MKKRTFWATLGAMIFIISAILGFAFVVRGPTIYELLLSIIGIALGILIIAWFLGD